MVVLRLGWVGVWVLGAVVGAANAKSKGSDSTTSPFSAESARRIGISTSNREGETVILLKRIKELE